MYFIIRIIENAFHALKLHSFQTKKQTIYIAALILLNSGVDL